MVVELKSNHALHCKMSIVTEKRGHGQQLYLLSSPPRCTTAPTTSPARDPVATLSSALVSFSSLQQPVLAESAEEDVQRQKEVAELCTQLSEQKGKFDKFFKESREALQKLKACKPPEIGDPDGDLLERYYVESSTLRSQFIDSSTKFLAATKEMTKLRHNLDREYPYWSCQRVGY